MNNNVHFILLAVVCCAICIIVTRVLKNYRFKQLIDCIKTKNIEKFSKIANSRFTRLLFPPYNIEYLKLNALLMEEDNRKIDDQFEKMLNFHLADVQRSDLVLKAFYYYLTQENKTKCKKLLDEIKENQNSDIYQEALKVFRILIENSTEYIQEMEDQLKTSNPQDQSNIEYLLSVQYKNAGNLKKADFYKKQSLSHAGM